MSLTRKGSGPAANETAPADPTTNIIKRATTANKAFQLATLSMTFSSYDFREALVHFNWSVLYLYGTLALRSAVAVAPEAGRPQARSLVPPRESGWHQEGPKQLARVV